MLRSFLAALFTLVVLDALWLGLVAADFYRRSLAPIARMSNGGLAPIWPIAALVYPAIALGISVFVLGRSRSHYEALAYGALYGAITFAVYDLTNHSTLREWQTTMTLVDIAWGAFSCAAASSAAHAIGR